MNGTLTGQAIGEYIVGPLIGGGGMGEVYQAYPTQGGQAVAMKVMNAELADDTSFQERFIREARVMQALQHENIVPILDYGVQDQLLYFVMSLVSGPSLERLLQRQAFTPRDTWKIAQPLCKAIMYMHEQGVIHRDIKPSNVFLQYQREGYHVFVGDFGLSKRPGTDQTLTRIGSRVGTADYMSPEAQLGDKLDQRTDIYSLGVLLYEMMLGRLPADPQYDHLHPVARTVQPVLAPQSINPAFPKAVQLVLLKALQAKREERYQAVETLADDLYTALKQLTDEQRKAIYWLKIPTP
jgi:serine/threonine-protein kinase